MSATLKQAHSSQSKASLANKAYRQAAGHDEPDWTLLEQYLPLVKSIVSKMRIYLPPHADMEDIYSIAVTGLIKAIRGCDVEKTKSFPAYAALRIRGAILDELRKMDWMPRNHRIQAKRLRQVVSDLEQKLMRPATEDEICEAMEMSRSEYLKLLDQVRPITLVSLDSDAGDTSESGPIHEIITDETEQDARDVCDRREMLELLRDRIQELPDIPRKVLMLYYYEGLRLAEIAEVFGVTESRICQIHAQAVISLRTYLARISKG